MNMLASLKTDPSVKVAEDKDVLGGGRQAIDSGAYPGVITMAYTMKSDGGAMGLVIIGQLGEEKTEVRQTLWVTSGNAKGNKPYYTKDGENFPLPGFSIANSLCLLTTGKELSDQETETKVVKVYNKDAQAEVATNVEALVELIGQEVIFGVIKQVVDKTKKNDATGAYDATGETREENEIDKFFCAKDGFLNMTSTEIKAQATEPVFYAAWVEKNAGQVRNKATGASKAGTPGAPAKAGAGAAGTTKPTTSLVGSKT